ncbi:MAG: hypothetical protein HWQ41_30450 [Nostoc sp. NOS(2021)]|nr:hypothetical protein [Nostoc sp. NOS(2021)]MBN3899432.1 hypothetical protein [Nostoc sp. NOS(2021)]
MGKNQCGKGDRIFKTIGKLTHSLLCRFNITLIVPVLTLIFGSSHIERCD